MQLRRLGKWSNLRDFENWRCNVLILIIFLMAPAVVSKPTDRFFIHYDAKKIRPSSSRIALANQTYQCRDGDSQGFSRSLDCTLKSRKPMKSYLTPKQLSFEYDVSETAVIRWCRPAICQTSKLAVAGGLTQTLTLNPYPMNGQVREGMKSKGC